VPQTHEFHPKEKTESFIEIQLELSGLSRKIHIQEGIRRGRPVKAVDGGFLIE
jgi:hypothetical protein